MNQIQHDLEIIEGLDFDHEPPCEHSEHVKDPVHQGAAEVLALASGCDCADVKWVYLCAGFWSWVCSQRGTVYCPCGTSWPNPRDAYLVVRMVR